MYFIIFFNFLLFIACIHQSKGECANNATDGPIVETSFGPIRGYIFKSPWTGQQIVTFNGVPYASPPVGDLRFKDPVPPEKWTSIKDCTQEHADCFQVGAKYKLMSEDCLYLNVYSPELRMKETPLPVMVFVHGGAFKMGSGGRRQGRPDMLVAEGVVVVMFNYRLNAFGFLSLGTRDIPGNSGLKDQRMVLKWVQKEIRKFGGDPGRVTLFGMSSGSSSAHFHYLSPSSKGLFHRVIGESGTTLTIAFKDRWRSVVYGLELAKALNCSIEDLSATSHCLRATSASEIVKAQANMKDRENVPLDSLGMLFLPTVDEALSDEPFMPEHPHELLKNHQGPTVPFLMGTTSEEGISFLFYNHELVWNIRNYLDQFIPPKVRNTSSHETIQKMIHKLDDYYFKNSSGAERPHVEGCVDLFTDFIFAYDTLVSARQFRHSNPVYLYYFTFDGPFKPPRSRIPMSIYNVTGADHVEEINYLLVRGMVNQTTNPDSKEMKVWKRMVRLWTNFAKYGSPTTTPDPLLQNVSWTPVGNETFGYLRIGEDLKMEPRGYMEPAASIWNSIYSKNIT